MNKEKLKHLNQFSGTENYYHMGQFMPNFCYTDGVKYLAENADCYWLLQAIASHQLKAMKDPQLARMQFWTLKPFGDNRAVLTCERDKDDVVIQQVIQFTDFPFDTLPEQRIWVGPSEVGGKPVMVALLPSEY